jgi:hypothetical protein
MSGKLVWVLHTASDQQCCDSKPYRLVGFFVDKNKVVIYTVTMFDAMILSLSILAYLEEDWSRGLCG